MMIELNYNLEVGQEIIIPRALSWQTTEANVGGAYIVKEFDDVYALLLRKNDAAKLLVPRKNVAYFTGKKVENAEPFKLLNPNEYQPDDTDYKSNYYTTDKSDYGFRFGFWYVGLCGDHDVLSSNMLRAKWFYVPWDADGCIYGGKG